MLKNAVTLYLTAADSAATKKWVDHFAELLGFASVTECRGVWKGGFETTQKVEHTFFGADILEFMDLVEKVTDEVRLYQVEERQEAALIDVCLAGQCHTSGLLYTELDYAYFRTELRCAISREAIDRMADQWDGDVDAALRHGFPLP